MVNNQTLTYSASNSLYAPSSSTVDSPGFPHNTIQNSNPGDGQSAVMRFLTTNGNGMSQTGYLASVATPGLSTPALVMGQRVGSGYAERLRIDPLGNVGIGTFAPAAGLDVATTGTAGSALIVPRDTTANRPSAPVNGMLRYNNSINAMEGYVAGAWATLATGSTTSGLTYLDVGSAANKIVQENANAQIAQTFGTAALPAYAFAGNTATGMYSPGAGQLALVTSGSSAMSIASNGDVSFTSNTPSNTNYTGAVRVAGGLGVVGQISANQIVTNNLIASNYAVVPYASSGTEPNGSSVIVQNSAPVDASVAMTKLLVLNQTSQPQSAFLAAVAVPGINLAPAIVLGQKSTGVGYTERLRIDPLGNVGIGTFAPAAGLDVATTGTAGSALIVPRDTTGNRPVAAVNGMLRYNTNAARFEGYQNGAWGNLITSTVATGSASAGQVQFATAAGVGGSPNFLFTETAGLTLNTAAALTATGSTSLATTSVGGPATFNGNATFGKVVAQGIVADTNGSLDAGTSNVFTTSFACGTLTLNNVVRGSSYTIVATDPGTAMCNFSIPGYTPMFMPANDVRIASSHTIYNLMVVGTNVYITWSSGFKP